MDQETWQTPVEATYLSQARKNVVERTGDLTFPEVDGFPIWEVFTQKKKSDMHIHAGSLSAPDASFAQQFAREHYGQDQECASLWVCLRSAFVTDRGKADSYEVFVQWKSGDRYVHVGSVQASSGTDAKAKGIEAFAGKRSTCSIWTCPFSELTRIDGETEMIWRTTDQQYRLARGYSKVVRKKWEALRSKKMVDTYQDEDLKETY